MRAERLSKAKARHRKSLMFVCLAGRQRAFKLFVAGARPVAGYAVEVTWGVELGARRPEEMGLTDACKESIIGIAVGQVAH